MSELPELLPTTGENLAGTDTGREHLSHSALATFLACPQKYGFSYEQRLEPIRKPEPLTLGKAYQLAIEHGDPAAGARSLREEADIQSQADEDKLQTQEAIVTAAASLYLATWPPEADLATNAMREFPYRVRLRNPYTGYLSRTFDLLGYADEIRFQAGSWLLVENKLVGQISEMQVRRLPLDRQVALEAYGVWRATGHPVTRVSYRFVRKPSIRQRSGETVAEFCERLTQDYVERPAFYAHEETWLRDTEDLVRIELELWEWAEMLRSQRRMPAWTRNTAHCTDYGGCPFIPLCLGERAEGLYRERATRHDAESDLATSAVMPSDGLLTVLDRG